MNSFNNDIRKRSYSLFKAGLILTAVGAVGVALFWGAISYVAIHFLAKVW